VGIFHEAALLLDVRLSPRSQARRAHPQQFPRRLLRRDAWVPAPRIARAGAWRAGPRLAIRHRGGRKPAEQIEPAMAGNRRPPSTVPADPLRPRRREPSEAWRYTDTQYAGRTGPEIAVSGQRSGVGFGCRRESLPDRPRPTRDCRSARLPTELAECRCPQVCPGLTQWTLANSARLPHAARTLRAASSQALMRSMSGTSPFFSTRWPAGVVAKAMRSAHSFSASALAMASAER
jgi:hypothetical protein